MQSPDAFDARDRLLAVEERLTFQQKMLDELHEAVLQQDRRLEKIARELAACGVAVERVLQRTGEDLPHEKPPHY